MQRTWTWRRTQKTPFGPGWAVSLQTSEGASQETGEDGARLGSLVSSELKSTGEQGADLECSRGTSDRALGQGWLLGHFCPSALPPQHFLGSEGTGESHHCLYSSQTSLHGKRGSTLTPLARGGNGGPERQVVPFHVRENGGNNPAEPVRTGALT